MSSETNQQEKARLHSRNKNRERYDLSALVLSNPELKKYVIPNTKGKFGGDSINFSDPIAVRLLNKALLNHYYGIKNWEFPDENLCPPIPGRADYLHNVADLFGADNFGRIPTGNKVTCLDIGVGASCIYPLIGVTEYDWNFIGTDIDPRSIASAQQIAKSNPTTKNKIEFRLQENANAILKGIIGPEDKFDISICNPPFHSSSQDAEKETRRKLKNLSGKNSKTLERNFAGISNELICGGGENKFIHTMIRESEIYSQNCYWFSTLVSKQSNLKGINKALEKADAKQVKTIPLGTSNKSSRIVAWTFLSRDEKKEWRETRWKE